MPNVQVAASIVALDIEVVFQPFEIVRANNHHGLVRSIVFGIGECVSRNELKTTCETSFEFQGQRIVLRARCALEQTNARKTGNRTGSGMTQYCKRLAAWIG